MQSNTISVQSAIKDGLLFSFVVWKCLNHKLVKAIHPVTLSSLLCTLLSLDVFFLQISNIMLSNRFHSRILARQENSKVFISKDRCQTEGRYFFPLFFNHVWLFWKTSAQAALQISCFRNELGLFNTYLFICWLHFTLQCIHHSLGMYILRLTWWIFKKKQAWNETPECILNCYVTCFCKVTSTSRFS